LGETDWNSCSDPTRLLAFVRARLSDRKLRLFAAACCRRVWHLLRDERSRMAVVAGEWLADGADVTDLRDLRLEAESIASRGNHAVRQAARAAAWVVWFSDVRNWYRFNGRDLWVAVEEARSAAAKAASDGREERRSQCALFRDLAGNPFRPAAVDPRWLRWNDGTVLKMARRVYNDRAYYDLPILADALEEAGCEDATLLAHCRRPGDHVRGCWAVDLLLGMS
jgi:hypothetical protein